MEYWDMLIKMLKLLIQKEFTQKVISKQNQFIKTISSRFFQDLLCFMLIMNYYLEKRKRLILEYGLLKVKKTPKHKSRHFLEDSSHSNFFSIYKF